MATAEAAAERLPSAATGDQPGSPLDDTGHKPRQNVGGSTPGFGRGQLVGYVSVSTADQDVARQVTELAAAGCSRVFRDEGVSGAKMIRPGLDAALDFLRDGDTLVVNELSRLGRDAAGVLALVRDLEARGVALRILGLGLDTATPTGRLVLTVLAAVAEMERELFRERIRSGIAEAKRQGRTGGRPPALTVDQRALAMRVVGEGQSPVQVSRECWVVQCALCAGLSPAADLGLVSWSA